MITQQIFEISTLLLAGLVLVHLWRSDRHWFLYFFAAVVLGFAVEVTAIRVYHSHYYSGFLVNWGDGADAFPIVIAFGWALVVWSVAQMANRLDAPWPMLCFVEALLAVSLDLFLDPMVSHAHDVGASGDSCFQTTGEPEASLGLGFWTWCVSPVQKKDWFDVPAENFLAWFALVLVFSFTWRMVERIPLNALFRRLARRRVMTGGWVALLLIGSFLSAYLGVSLLLLGLGFLITQGLPSWWILGFLGFIGAATIVRCGGVRRNRRWVLLPLSLLALDSFVLWYGYVAEVVYEREPVDSPFFLAMFSANVLALLLAVWVLRGTREKPILRASGRWTHHQLDEFRNRADPPADSVVQALFTNRRVESTNALLAELFVRDGQRRLDKNVQDFLETTGKLPAWADADRIQRAQQLFYEYSPICFASFLLASLPECYLNGRGVDVLGQTRQLQDNGLTRIYQTAVFVLYVMRPGGLSKGPQGNGIKATQQIRLVHGAIRHLLLRRASSEAPSPYEKFEWRLDERGQPSSQEDLAHTLMTFSWVVLRSLRILGAYITPCEEEDFMHTWRVIGHLLGIDEELLPRSVVEAEELFELIKHRNEENTENGRELTRVTIGVMETMLADKIPYVGRVMGPGLTRVLIHELLDDGAVRQLRVESMKWYDYCVSLPFFWAVRTTLRVVDRFTDRALRYLKVKVGEYLMEYFTEATVEVRPFRIPTELARISVPINAIRHSDAPLSVESAELLEVHSDREDGPPRPHRPVAIIPIDPSDPEGGSSSANWAWARTKRRLRSILPVRVAR